MTKNRRQLFKSNLWLGNRNLILSTKRDAFMFGFPVTKGNTKVSEIGSYLSWFEAGANNKKVVGSIPIWTIHLKIVLDDPFGSL